MPYLRQLQKSLRFSLRTLLGVTGLVAVFFSVGCTVGYMEATGTVVAIALLAWSAAVAVGAWRFRGAAVGFAVLWMTAVDLSSYVENCRYCRLDLDTLHVRVYGHSLVRIPLREYGVLHLIAEDLGRPCPHRFKRWHMTRFCGLFVPGSPRSHCHRLIDEGPPSWYDEETVRILQERAEASPDVPEEFYAAIMTDDRAYIRRFIRELIEERTGEPYPPGT